MKVFHFRTLHSSVCPNDRDLLQPVSLANLEVVFVVSGRDFDDAGSEGGVHALVGDNSEMPAGHQGMDGATGI